MGSGGGWTRSGGGLHAVVAWGGGRQWHLLHVSSPHFVPVWLGSTCAARRRATALTPWDAAAPSGGW